MEYKIAMTSTLHYLHEYDLITLQNTVNEYIKEGYIPQGGLVVFNRNKEESTFLLQAIVKPDEKNKQDISKSDITWENE